MAPLPSIIEPDESPASFFFWTGAIVYPTPKRQKLSAFGYAIVISAITVFARSNVVAGQGQRARRQGCLEDLLPCTAYLKTAKHPSQTCCTAMHNAAAAEMPCLCSLFADQELLSTFNVTRDQMFRLPARCGLPVGCRAGATAAHEPVVEAPPPPAGTHHHQHGASPRSSEFWSVWRVAASVVLGQMVLMAAVF
ncbi:non-specific lipid transfer protein GPI-anchored 7-like [Panicum virgatum]|uniref:non-specific lipid transfer protein GPI-anchored 7-like n=1 Tax=Panicum virgatum TaxID=38727 RepID=UPI0019D5F012|nr:non-specific lipid transfer protein GPI-anchored 7-like [Panicum virgatum]